MLVVSNYSKQTIYFTLLPKKSRASHLILKYTKVCLPLIQSYQDMFKYNWIKSIGTGIIEITNFKIYFQSLSSFQEITYS